MKRLSHITQGIAETIDCFGAKRAAILDTEDMLDDPFASFIVGSPVVAIDGACSTISYLLEKTISRPLYRIEALLTGTTDGRNWLYSDPIIKRKFKVDQFVTQEGCPNQIGLIKDNNVFGAYMVKFFEETKDNNHKYVETRYLYDEELSLLKDAVLKEKEKH